MTRAESAFFTQRNDAYPHLLYTTQTASGDLRLDWASFTAYNPTPIATLSELASGSNEPASAPFRVVATPSHYHNFQFADTGTWLALELRVPAEDRTVHAYARRGSELAESLASLTEQAGAPARLTLQLEASPESASTGQFRIRAPGNLVESGPHFAGQFFDQPTAQCENLDARALGWQRQIEGEVPSVALERVGVKEQIRQDHVVPRADQHPHFRPGRVVE